MFNRLTAIILGTSFHHIMVWKIWIQGNLMAKIQLKVYHHAPVTPLSCIHMIPKYHIFTWAWSIRKQWGKPLILKIRMTPAALNYAVFTYFYNTVATESLNFNRRITKQNWFNMFICYVIIQLLVFSKQTPGIYWIFCFISHCLNSVRIRRFFSSLSFSVKVNAEKYGLEKALNLDTFHVVSVWLAIGYKLIAVDVRGMTES